MSKLIVINHVREICDRMGLDEDGFIGACLQGKNKVKLDTAKRLYRGDTNFHTETVIAAAEALGVRMEDLFETKKVK